jgi:RND family efflux transporter MFP subunit
MIMAFALFLPSCTGKPLVEAPEIFPIAVPGQAAAFYDHEYVGEVQAIQRAEILARVKGRIESVLIDEGQPVKANQILFLTGVKELRQEIRKARAVVASAVAALKGAEVERTNMKMLLDKAVVSPAEMALLNSKIQSLAANLNEARANEGLAAINLGYSEVRAPFAGVVNRLPKKAGSMVAEGDLLTTVTDTSEVLVYFRVSEQEYLEYASAKGDGRPKEVSFMLANGQRLPVPGVMDAVETEVDKHTGTIAFRGRFKNEGQLLKHGSTGKVIMKVDVKDGLTIPQKSTFEVQDQVYVYTLDAEGKARARRIHPRLRIGGMFVVESGITANERFIVEGAQKIKDGEAVATRLASSPGPASR